MKRALDDTSSETPPKIHKEDDDSIFDNLDELDECQDTYLSLQLLRKLIEPATRFTRMPPVLMKHMLFGILKNHTEIEQTLEDLVHKNKIRQFYLNTIGNDKTCYLFTDDYLQIFTYTSQQYKKNQISSSKSFNSDVLPDSKRKTLQTTLDFPFNDLFEKFVKNVILKYSDTHIRQSDLKKMMETDDVGLNHLSRMGLFTIKDEDSLWFAIPHVGSFVTSLVNGRKEVLGIIQKKKFKEILIRDLYRKPLKTTKLTTPFIVRDLVTLEKVSLLDTTNGTLLCLKT